MSLAQSFFDYPDQEAKGQAEELVFLPDWSEADWEKFLAHTQAQRFREGDIVLRQGDADRAIDVVVTGALEVLVPQRGRSQRRLTTIDAGSVIGEVAFFDGQPRSATVRALSDGELLRLSYDSFEVFAAREPEMARQVLLDLGRILAVRLRQTNATLSA